MSAGIPVTIVGGYLGAGKTTLVNHLLRHAAGRRLAVLVNDFGDLPIDADLVEARGDGVLSIAGGCVCCSFGSDLMAGLEKLKALDPPPQHLLVETSGVALPGAVAGAVRLVPGFALDAVVVLVDAETVRARAADRYMADTVERQLLEADLIVVNKLDLVAPEDAKALAEWLEGRTRARLIEATRARVPIEVLLGTSLSGGVRASNERSPASGVFGSPVPAGSGYEGVSYSPAASLRIGALAEALLHPSLGLLRAKGVLRDTDGRLKLLHVVGRRSEVVDAPDHLRAPLGCVCIGLKGVLDRPALDRMFEPAQR